jgi:hypothetical protein
MFWRPYRSRDGSSTLQAPVSVIRDTESPRPLSGIQQTLGPACARLQSPPKVGLAVPTAFMEYWKMSHSPLRSREVLNPLGKPLQYILLLGALRPVGPALFRVI